MKKITYIVLFLFLCLPLDVFAAYADRECDVQVYKINHTIDFGPCTGTGLPEGFYIDSNGLVRLLPGVYPTEGYCIGYDITMINWWFESGQWYSNNDTEDVWGPVIGYEDPLLAHPTECPPPPCPEGVEEAALEECGIAENLDWDPVACTGTCKCDLDTLSREVALCLGSYVIDYDTCTVTCGHGECFDQIKASCDPYGVDWWQDNVEGCIGGCVNNCDEQWNNLRSYCGDAGVQEYRESDCWGVCNPPLVDCSDFRANCENECSRKGGIANYFCDPELSSTVCDCNWDQPISDPEQPDPLVDPPPGSDPDPVPDADPNVETNQWLSAIKHNTDGVLEVNTNVAENVRRMVDNQGVVVDTLNRNGDRVVESLKNINVDVSGVESRLDTTNSSLSDLVSNSNSLKSALNDVGSVDTALGGIPDNVYDGTIADNDLPTLEDFQGTAQSFIDTNPLSGFLSQSDIDLVDQDPCFHIPNPYTGGTESFCMDQYASTWSAMGILMVALSFFSAFRIVKG